MRGYLFVIFSIGMFGALVGEIVPRSPGKAPAAIPHAFDVEAVRVAELKAKTQPQFVAQDGSVALQREPDGHFYADVKINGATISALVDTGASGIALTRADARKAGVATSIAMPGVVGQGADGDVYGEFVTLDSVSLGDQTAAGIPATVLNAGEQTLLGQSFLSRFSKVEISGDTMVLR